MFSKSKKGNAILDTLTVVAVIVVFALMSIVGFKILTDINTDFQSNDDFNDISKEKLAGLESNYPKFMDYLFLTMLVLLFIATIIFSFLVDTHPVFLIVSIVMSIALLFIGGVISNAYQEIMSDGLISVTGFPITNFIMSNLIIVTVVFTLGIGLALYGKSRSGGGL